jgi:hypothetical protein
MNNNHAPLSADLDAIIRETSSTTPLDLTEDEGPAPEPFPIEALDGLIAGDMVKEISCAAQVPEALAAAAVLGVASGAIGAGLRCTTYRGTTSANLWFLAVARSGTGKDECLKRAAAPLYDLEERRAETWKTDIVPDLEADLRIAKNNLAALEKALKDDQGPEMKTAIRDAERERARLEDALSHEPIIAIGDVTKEALGVLLSRQPGEAALCVNAEARGILDVIGGRYSATGDEDLWLAAFSGGAVKVNRIGRKSITLRRPCLAACLMVQPDSFARAAARPEMAESGFLPRFLPFDAKARPRRIENGVTDIAPDTAEAWRELIEELVDTFRDSGDSPVTVSMEPEATRLMNDYANELADRRELDLADLDAYAARWAEIACRLALVLHAIEHGPRSATLTVSAITATRAHRLVEWFSVEAADLLGDLRENRRRDRRDKLERLLEGADDRTMTTRDLTRRHGFSLSEIEDLLPKIGGEIKTKQSDRGRPSTVAALVKTPKP